MIPNIEDAKIAYAQAASEAAPTYAEAKQYVEAAIIYYGNIVRTSIVDGEQSLRFTRPLRSPRLRPPAGPIRKEVEDGVIAEFRRLGYTVQRESDAWRISGWD